MLERGETHCNGDTRGTACGKSRFLELRPAPLQNRGTTKPCGTSLGMTAAGGGGATFWRLEAGCWRLDTAGRAIMMPRNGRTTRPGLKPTFDGESFSRA